ncbi:MAG: hypothetical protein JXA21_11275 [Anaerolineae bacterium]|nr:hypothetical protein [Anaerolineae bacterium]
MGMAFTEHHGYKFFDVVSALQKDIRRGNEEQAMYWALELIPRYEAYLWLRLLAILNEDVGIASPPLLAIVPELRREFFEFREAGKNGPARLVLANAILLMCRAAKCRLADHFQRAITQRFMTWEKLAIPDYARDHHTDAGKRQGRGVDFWLEEGCRLEPQGDVPDPYKIEAEALWRAGKKDAPDWPARKGKHRKGEEESQMRLF